MGDIEQCGNSFGSSPLHFQFLMTSFWVNRTSHNLFWSNVVRVIRFSNLKRTCMHINFNFQRLTRRLYVVRIISIATAYHPYWVRIWRMAKTQSFLVILGFFNPTMFNPKGAKADDDWCLLNVVRLCRLKSA